ncbi:MAG TPA: histidine--tRNA ligase [Sphingomicrobium sp.]
MTPVQPVRGTQSLLGEDADRLAAVVGAFDRVRRLFGFKRVEVPTIEPTQVFARTIGETTDVVSKEMYSFDDRGGESITLRPEFTAGICRAYLSEGWQQHAPLKVAAHGSAFRYERPQKGRFREFHQLDAEIIGAAEPQADVEILSLGYQLLQELGIADGVTLRLNTLGDSPSREAWRKRLIEFFMDHRTGLSEDSQSRLATNPLRILDSKDVRDKAISSDAPIIDEFLTPEAGEFLNFVENGLQDHSIPYVRDYHLVRGLDYYRHTAFEFVTDRLGSQGAVVAGGRYDGLIESLGGPQTPAVGWAAGIERLAMMIDPPSPETSLIVTTEEVDQESNVLRVVAAFRQSGIPSEALISGAPRKRFDKAKKRSNGVVVMVLSSEEPSAFNVLPKIIEFGDAMYAESNLRSALETHFQVREGYFPYQVRTRQ